MTKKGRKHKRGERESTEEQVSSPKRVNMADAEEREETESEPTRAELKEMLVDIQINVANIVHDNLTLKEDLAKLKETLEKQQSELLTLKPAMKELQEENEQLEKALDDAQAKIDEQQEEIAELYDLQDKLEQYTRKNSLEIHGIPENAYSTTEEAVLKVAESLDVAVRPEDIEISHKLNRDGVKPIIVKFVSHKTKTSLYKQRTKLKNFTVSDIFPCSSAATRVQSKGIFINENLTSYRRELLKEANKKRKDHMVLSVWTMDGNIFVKTSPEGKPVKIYAKNDLEDL